MKLVTIKNSITADLQRQPARLWSLVTSPRWTIALGITTLLALVALSTFNGVTADRFAADLAITRWVQKFQVNESLEEVLFYILFETLAGVIVAVTVLWLWFRSGHRVDAVVLVLAKFPKLHQLPPTRRLRPAEARRGLSERHRWSRWKEFPQRTRRSGRSSLRFPLVPAYAA